MLSAHRRYQPVGPVLVRASTYPAKPDESSSALTDPTATVPRALAWLAEQWSRSELREAVTVASPGLAGRVHQLLQADAASPERAVHRAVMATAAYLARWQRRATPFGLFAGATAATVGPAVARIGHEHRAVARVDADWLTQILDRLEQHRPLRCRLMVVANSGGFVRDDRFIVAARPQPDEHSPGPLRETSTRHTRPVQIALACAARPLRFDQLAAQLVRQLPHADQRKIEALLHGLIDAHVLITNLRPPMTTVDALAHVVETLRAATVADLPDVAALADQLSEIQAQLRRHNVADRRQQQMIRATVADRMARVAPGDALSGYG